MSGGGRRNEYTRTYNVGYVDFAYKGFQFDQVFFCLYSIERESSDAKRVVRLHIRWPKLCWSRWTSGLLHVEADLVDPVSSRLKRVTPTCMRKRGKRCIFFPYSNTPQVASTHRYQAAAYRTASFRRRAKVLDDLPVGFLGRISSIIVCGAAVVCGRSGRCRRGRHRCGRVTRMRCSIRIVWHLKR